jgi:hypothetical protein
MSDHALLKYSQHSWTCARVEVHVALVDFGGQWDSHVAGRSDTAEKQSGGWAVRAVCCAQVVSMTRCVQSEAADWQDES